MCGIVGYIGQQNVVDIVLKGLKRLEYRGYDSAGVSFKKKGGLLTLVKKAGKLENLEGELEARNLRAQAGEIHSCVGHTRWATHGKVNDQNAHPHYNGQVAIVHNGIIENATELKESLIRYGLTFHSDEESDSEVFLGLITREVDEGRPFKNALLNAFAKIKGNSAFVIQSKDTDDLYGIKRGNPLVCGANSISSDPYALTGLSNELYFPEDDVLCHLKSDGQLDFYDREGIPINSSQIRRQELQDVQVLQKVEEKGEFEHFMLKEIFEQPALIRNLVTYYFEGLGKEALHQVKGYRPSRIHITACGSAFYAGLLIQNFVEKRMGIPCHVELGSEFRYRAPLLFKEDLGLFISQSGETADTLAAQSLCRQNGSQTFSITNGEGTTLFRECDHNFLICAGREIGVASTKAFTQMVLTGHLLSEAMASTPSNRCFLPESLSLKFHLLADRVQELLDNVDGIMEIAKKVHSYKGFFYTGRGQYFPVAMEGALKLKEIAYVHAEGHASGELKHGPIAVIDEEMVNVAIVGPELLEKTLSNAQEIKARGGVIVGIGPKGHKGVLKVSDFFIPLNFDGLGEHSSLYVNVVNQLFAYYVAKCKGTDIDRPRNLAKSVTVE